MKIKTPYGTHPATVANLMQDTGIGAIYRVTPDSTGSLRYGVATRATKKEAQYYSQKHQIP